MICKNCGRPISGKICDYCGADYRTDEEKKEVECDHLFESVIFEESIKDMTVNLLFKCRNCKQVTTIRTTLELFRSIARW